MSHQCRPPTATARRPHHNRRGGSCATTRKISSLQLLDRAEAVLARTAGAAFFGAVGGQRCGDLVATSLCCQRRRRNCRRDEHGGGEPPVALHPAGGRPRAGGLGLPRHRRPFAWNGVIGATAAPPCVLRHHAGGGHRATAPWAERAIAELVRHLRSALPQLHAPRLDQEADGQRVAQLVDFLQEVPLCRQPADGVGGKVVLHEDGGEPSLGLAVVADLHGQR
mmetsp:Transcript_98391/g.283938  ORF Transcript_98391/g.283938 Transcript_98391/m.283938 type:complete len:223 (+) Transcript_98391:125-793(+)